MKTHASYDGYLCKLAKVYKDNETIPNNARLVSYYAKYVNPTDNYAFASSCVLYFIPGIGYAASSIRKPK